MTQDRDFKQLVRQRAAKTGESYQAARRQLERRRPAFCARVVTTFRRPAGLVFGCVMEEGRVWRGMSVTVISEGTAHEAVVTSLRRGWTAMDTVAEGQFADGQFGMVVEPAYIGPLPERVVG